LGTVKLSLTEGGDRPRLTIVTTASARLYNKKN